MSVVDRVYARALFEAAQEKGRLEAVREQLEQVVTAAAEVPELRELLRNPQLDPRARAAALEEVLAGGDQLLRNFLLVLVDKGRIGELEVISEEFERLVAEQEGVLSAELTTAVELSDDDEHRLLQQIEAACRPGPDRRHRSPGRLAPARRKRARPARSAAQGAGGS